MALRTMVLGAFCVEDRYLVEVRCFLNIKKHPAAGEHYSGCETGRLCQQ